MGLFSQRKDEENTWAALPGEPLEHDAVDDLDDTAPVDPLEVGLGAQTTSITFPVDPPPSETAFRG